MGGGGGGSRLPWNGDTASTGNCFQTEKRERSTVGWQLCSGMGKGGPLLVFLSFLFPSGVGGSGRRTPERVFL